MPRRVDWANGQMVGIRVTPRFLLPNPQTTPPTLPLLPRPSPPPSPPSLLPCPPPPKQNQPHQRADALRSRALELVSLFEHLALFAALPEGDGAFAAHLPGLFWEDRRLAEAAVRRMRGLEGAGGGGGWGRWAE